MWCLFEFQSFFNRKVHFQFVFEEIFVVYKKLSVIFIYCFNIVYYIAA